MIIACANEELREWFEIPALAIEKFGPEVARAMALRFADLTALSNASELILFAAEYGKIGSEHVARIDLANNYILVVAQNHISLREHDAISWEEVTRVRILTIEPRK